MPSARFPGFPPHTRRPHRQMAERVGVQELSPMVYSEKNAISKEAVQSQSQRTDDGKGDRRGADAEAADVRQGAALHHHVLVVLFHLGDFLLSFTPWLDMR